MLTLEIILYKNPGNPYNDETHSTFYGLKGS